MQKSITVTTDDPQYPEYRLSVSTDVEVAFAMSQPNLNLGRVKAGTSQVYYLSLVGSDRDKNKITAITSTHKIIDAELNQAGFDNDPYKKLKITLHTDIPIGRAYDRVTLETDHPQVPKLYVTITGDIVGDIMVEPNYLSFGVFDPSVENVRQVRLAASGTTTFKVIGVQPPMEGLETEIKTVAEGKIYEVKLTAKPGFTSPIIRGNLLIQTDNQKQPEIKINVTGRPRTDLKPTQG